MVASVEEYAIAPLQPGDVVELTSPLERYGLRKGARGRIVAELRYWNVVRVDFGRGRQIAVDRERLRPAA